MKKRPGTGGNLMRFRKGLFAALCCSGALTAACTLLAGVFPLPGALGVVPIAVWSPFWIGWENAAAWGLLVLGAAQAASLATGCVGLWRNSRRLTAAAVFAYGSDCLCAAVMLFASAARERRRRFSGGHERSCACSETAYSCCSCFWRCAGDVWWEGSRRQPPKSAPGEPNGCPYPNSRRMQRRKPEAPVHRRLKWMNARFKSKQRKSNGDNYLINIQIV